MLTNTKFHSIVKKYKVFRVSAKLVNIYHFHESFEVFFPESPKRMSSRLWALFGTQLERINIPGGEMLMGPKSNSDITSLF